MIKNDRQYRATKAAIEQFEQSLATRSTSPPDEIHPTFWEMERRAMEGELASLKQTIVDYDGLRSGARGVSPIESWSDVPRALIEGRIAANLTQRDLALRLEIAEQQLQRYESTDYASASLSRIQEVAAALGLSIAGVVSPKEMDVSPRRFFEHLKELGVDKKWFLERVVPPEVSAVLSTASRIGRDTATAALMHAAGIVATIFEISKVSLFESAPISLDTAIVGAARFKRPRSSKSATNSTKVRAYSSYAWFIGSRVAAAAEHLPRRPLPPSPDEWRHELAGRSLPVSFKSVLHVFWDHGVPVVPLADSGHFHGACWRLSSGREIVVLKQSSNSVDRWLGDLLHEGGHLSLEPGTEPFENIEKGDHPEIHDQRERAATEFASDVILDGRAEELADEIRRLSDGNVQSLKRIVPQVATRAQVSVGALASYVAYYFARESNGVANWWGTAQGFQDNSLNPWRVARDELLERIDLSVLSPQDQDIVVRAMSLPVSEISVNSIP